MREYSLPPLVPALTTGGLADSVYEVAERDPELSQLARDGGRDEGEWTAVTAAGFRDEVLGLAKGLLAAGVRFGERVAVMARTRYEWTQFCYALWSLGAQVVPVYPTSSAGQVRWILSNAQVSAIVVEHADHAMTVGAACDAQTGLRSLWQLDAGCVQQLTEQGRHLPDEMVHRHRRAVTPRSAAVIAYTSGTTGPLPRGCVITHANLAAECDTLYAGWRDLIAVPGEQPAVLAFLPLSHIYGLMVQVVCLRSGVLLGHQPDLSPASLLPALASFRPTYVFAVPYVFERILHAARRAAEEAGRGDLFRRAEEVAVRHAERTQRREAGEGPGPGPVLRAEHTVFDRLVYGRLRAVLGGRVRYATSGGSALDRELGLFFAGAGIAVHDGYGLTETSAAVTTQPPGRPRFGTVGRPLPGCAVRIADDGEIWVSGDVVFAGYHDDPSATAAVLRGGWFATGDVGRLDDDGYLVLTGRKKDIIVTSGGKSVSPQPLEQRLRRHPLISQCLVVGDNRPFVAALVTLDPDAWEHWRRSRERHCRRSGSAAAGGDLHTEIQRAVHMANSVVSRAESIRAFRILPTEFSVQDGLLTASLKLRRGAITQAYAAEIEAMYTS
ncbi:AMP-dependent synthetase/ligase [Streptomyces sp. MS06]|uniref:AMP-dependent synthetase/ligase n=1 Tax=Streptomyces sp. MS06 TaxID=3385974 RepID=UPI0039A2B45F